MGSRKEAMSTGRLVRAVCLGFMPGSGAVFLVALGGIALIAPHHVTWASIDCTLAELLGLTVGFAAALRLGGPRMDALRGLKWRSIAAGIFAPLVAGGIARLNPNVGLGAVPLLSVPAGALAALMVILSTHGGGGRLLRAGAGR